MVRETKSHVPPRTEQSGRVREAYKHLSYSFSMPTSRLVTTPLFIFLALSLAADGLVWTKGHTITF